MYCSLLAGSLILIGCVAQETTEYFSPTIQPPTNSCKTPVINKRRMDADVRADSPFYMVAVTRTPRTVHLDNVCYTYFEDDNQFLHIISMVFKNGTSMQAILHKHDLDHNLGVIEASGQQCLYHDNTMMPLCNYQVFPLYRCFVSGECSQLDAGPVWGVDVRLLMAVDPNLPDTCIDEIKAEFANTSVLAGRDFVILPQKLDYQCVTSYTLRSINDDHALGYRSLSQFKNQL